MTPHDSTVCFIPVIICIYSHLIPVIRVDLIRPFCVFLPCVSAGRLPGWSGRRRTATWRPRVPRWTASTAGFTSTASPRTTTASTGAGRTTSTGMLHIPSPSLWKVKEKRKHFSNTKTNQQVQHGVTQFNALWLCMLQSEGQRWKKTPGRSEDETNMVWIEELKEKPIRSIKVDLFNLVLCFVLWASRTFRFKFVVLLSYVITT